MRRAPFLALPLALLIGCGKKAPDPTPEKPEPPKPAPPAPQPPGDPNAGRPKNQPKALSPVAVIKTGAAVGPGDRNQVHLSADGGVAAVYAVAQKKTQIWKVGAEPKKLQEFPGGLVSLAPDGSKYLRTGAKGPEVVGAETGAVLATLERGGFLRAAFSSPDAVVSLTVGEGAEPKKAGSVIVREFEARTGKVTGGFEIPTAARGKNFAFFNGAKELAVGHRSANRVEFWDLAGKKKSREVTLANPPPKPAAEAPWGNFVVSEDGKLLALERQSGNRAFDATTGAELTPADLGDSTGSLAPNRRLYVYYKMRIDPKTSGVVKEYQAYDLTKGAVVATLPLPPDSLFHTASANGKVLLTERNNGELTVWDLTQIP
jgi:hypothetical protein